MANFRIYGYIISIIYHFNSLLSIKNNIFLIKSQDFIASSSSSRELLGWFPYAFSLIREFGPRGIIYLIKEDLNIILAFIKEYGLISGPPLALIHPIATSQKEDPAFKNLPSLYQETITTHEEAHREGKSEWDAYREELEFTLPQGPRKVIYDEEQGKIIISQDTFNYPLNVSKKAQREAEELAK